MEITAKILRINAMDILGWLRDRGLNDVQILEALATAQAALIFSRMVAKESSWHSRLEAQEARDALAEVGFSPVEIEKLVLVSRQNALDEMWEEFNLRHPPCPPRREG